MGRPCSTPSSSSANPIWTGVWSSSPGSIADFVDLALQNKFVWPRWVRPIAATLPLPTDQAAQLAAAGPAQRRPPLRSRRPALLAASSMPTVQYSCAYFATPDMTLEEAQPAKKRHIAAKLDARARPAGARHRLRLGRAGAVSCRDLRRRGHRASPCRRSSSRSPTAAPRRANLDGPRRFPLHRLPRRAGDLRPHRLGRHVRACRRRLLRDLLPQMLATSSPTTAWR